MTVPAALIPAAPPAPSTGDVSASHTTACGSPPPGRTVPVAWPFAFTAVTQAYVPLTFADGVGKVSLCQPPPTRRHRRGCWRLARFTVMISLPPMIVATPVVGSDAMAYA